MRRKWAKCRSLFIGMLVVMLASACQSTPPSPEPVRAIDTPVEQILAPSLTPSPTVPPTETPTPTPTSTPTPTPTPTLLVLARTSLPEEMAIITPGNAAEVSALAEWQVADVVDMDWVPDGNGLAIATSERIDLFDLYSREKLRSLYPQSTRLVSIDFSSDFFGKWLVAGSRWGSESEGFGSAIELWRGPDWQPRGILSGSTRALSQVEFSPNGRALAAVYSSPVEQENVIEFINTTQWTISSTLATGSVLGVNFSPDSTFLATSPNRYSVHIWEINPKTLAFRFLTAFTDAVNTMAYSPDGLILATGSYDGSLRLWDMQTGVLIQSIPTDAVIESLAFSPDGSLIATGGGFQDNLVRIWSVETKELLRELEGHTQGVNRVLFSPDGQFLVSGSYDGKVMLWGIRP